MADGKVTISTALDNSGIEKDSRKMVAKLASEYRKAGMSSSEAFKKAWEYVKKMNAEISKQEVPKPRAVTPQETPKAFAATDTSGAEKAAQASKEAAEATNAAADAADRAMDSASKAADASSQAADAMKSTAQGAAGVSATVDRQNAAVQRILNDTERSAKSKAASIAAIYRKQGLSQQEAFKKAWEHIERASAKSSKKVGQNIERNIGKSTQSVTGSLGGLKNVVGKLGTAFAAAFSVAAVVNFGVSASKAAMELSDALTGLQSILEAQGRSFSSTQAFIEEYTKDGLIPATNAITAYKNLASRGYDDSQIRQVMTALKDASAYGRQASYTMGEAVQGATEGLKNENSVLVDNAGVTKNVAKMWEEYAASIGTTASNLTQQQKIQAEVAGILEETKFQTGDAAKVAGTLSGQLQQLSFNFNNLKIAIGNAINPIVKTLLPVVNAAVAAMTRFANAVASVVSLLFGKAESVSSSQVSELADGYGAAADGAEDLADATTAAGKAAKKSLASFDEIQKLGDSSSGSGDTSVSSGGASIDYGSTLDDATSDVETVPPAIQAAVDKIRELIAPLQNISFDNLINSLGNAGTAFADLGGTISEALEWVWFNLLVPLSEWTIEEAAPATVDALTAAFDALDAALEPIVAGLEELKPALQPYISFIQGVALVVLNGLQKIFEKVAQTFEDKGDEIVQVFSNLGDALEAWWELAEPTYLALKEIVEDVFDYMAEEAGLKIGETIDALVGLTDFLAGVFSGDWSRAWSGIKSIFYAAKDYVVGHTKNMQKLLSPLWTLISSNATKEFSNLKTGLKNTWSPIVSNIKGSVNSIIDFFSPVIAWFSDLWGAVEQTISDVFYNIGVITSGCWQIVTEVWGVAARWFNTNVIQPVSKLFSGLWASFINGARFAWDSVKTVFGNVASFFKRTFRGAWQGVVEVFSVAGDIFVDIKDGILSSFKKVVNGLIGGLNNVIKVPFDGINSALRMIRNVKILDITPFAGVKTISTPKIPYLASGAVLPANNPFLAVVGDQRHGTNVEAPLETIQEAVAIVMEDMLKSNVAGFEATVAILREILQAILGIEIGDEVIGRAAARYQRRQNYINGGVSG